MHRSHDVGGADKTGCMHLDITSTVWFRSQPRIEKEAPKMERNIS